jgi:hypothetical protein
VNGVTALWNDLSPFSHDDILLGRFNENDYQNESVDDETPNENCDEYETCLRRQRLADNREHPFRLKLLCCVQSSWKSSSMIVVEIRSWMVLKQRLLLSSTLDHKHKSIAKGYHTHNNARCSKTMPEYYQRGQQPQWHRLADKIIGFVWFGHLDS